MLDKDFVKEIVARNPRVDPTAVERGREAARRLAEAGFTIGDYRLQPPLGGSRLGTSNPRSEQESIGSAG